jgi:peptide deformylase
MSLLFLRTYPDPVLRRPASPVETFDDRLRDLVREMTTQMRRHNGIGLAAPQVGVSRRVIVFDHDGRGGHLVNPVLLTRSEAVELGAEGCLSLPGVFADLPRHVTVLATGADLDGAPLTIDASGLLARCMQHEVDHLDGVLFIDRLEPSERRRVLAAYQEVGLTAVQKPSPRHHH